MACSECGSAPVAFSIPDEYREYAPDESGTVAFCPRCLTLEPAETSVEDHEPEPEPVPESNPDFSAVSDAFPTRPERAIPLALALDLCASLATNRSAIESLLRDVERAGADPLLVIDRLVDEPTVEPAIDLDRRRHQLEQLLY